MFRGCLRGAECFSEVRGRGRRAVSASSGRSALSRAITGGPHTRVAGAATSRCTLTNTLQKSIMTHSSSSSCGEVWVQPFYILLGLARAGTTGRQMGPGRPLLEHRRRHLGPLEATETHLSSTNYMLLASLGSKGSFCCCRLLRRATATAAIAAAAAAVRGSCGAPAYHPPA